MPKKKFGRGYRCRECNRNRRRTNWQRDVVKTCPICLGEFQTDRLGKVYCSVQCNGKADPARINNNPRRYFQSMLNPARVADGLKAEELLELLEKQEGKCALSGREMTFVRGQGPVDTNASIDRIEAGGPYTKDNIQLVCSAVNGFRRNIPLKTFIEWCSEVAEHSKAKGGRR